MLKVSCALLKSFRIIVAIAALSSIATPASAVEYTELSDAYKEAWTPPAPVRSLIPERPRRADPATKPDLSLRLSETPSAADLRRARVLATPLRSTVPQDTIDPRERRAMAGLLREFNTAGGHANTANRQRLADFLTDHPESPFSVSLLLEKADLDWKHGYFTDSLDTLRSAWQRGRHLRDVEKRRLAEIALSHLLRRLGQMGQKEELRARIAEADGRDLGGAAAEALRRAREALAFFDNQAEQNVFCGFTAANEICAPLGHRPIFPDVHSEEEEQEFIEFGLSLYELRAHSHEAGGNLRLVKRNDSSDFPVPSVVHWDYGHYSAITERSGDLYRVVDSHLKVDTWVSSDALDQQASGYFALEGTTEVPKGYMDVRDEEARTVFGRHCSHVRGAEGDDCPKGGNKKDCGMVTHSFRMLNAGIELFDTPIAYTPPFGPAVSFQLNYDQRSTVIPDLSDHGNFGPRWTYDFLAYITTDGSAVAGSDDEHWQKADVIFGNGNFYTYNYESSVGTYTTEYGDRPRLDYIVTASGDPAYQMTYSDGSIRLYEEANNLNATRFYLSQIIDPQGNDLILEYDSNLRLTTLRDELDQTTTIAYDEQSDDPNLIRSITDPFGRTATFDYTAENQLWKITDAEGIVSEMSYTTGNFVDAYTTPYGTWTIEWGTVPNSTSWLDGLFVQVTDPYGDRERVEQFDASLDQYDPGSAEPMPPSSFNVDGTTPVAFYPKDDTLNWRNSYHWDKQQMRYHAGDYTKATVYNWLALEGGTITGVPGSIKTPEVGRTWFNYWDVDSSGNLVPHTNQHSPGDIKAPAKVVRPVEDETGALAWQMTQNEYDPNFGNLTRTIDPLGREMIFEYNPGGTVSGAIPGIDLTAVKVDNGGTLETLATYSNFTNGLPQTVTDAAGTTTATTYNAEGQPTSITISKGSDSETTEFLYDDDFVSGPAAGASGTPSGRGYLTEVRRTDPQNPAQLVTLATYTYDTAGRVRTETDADGYTLTYDYDNFDRVTLVTHPDASTEQFVYEHLDLVGQKDRDGHWTRFWYSANRQPVLQQDPGGGLTALEWCRCGDIRNVTDPNGNVTRWKRDAQGRPYEKIYPDGTKTSYTYEPFSGNLESVTYANDQASGQPTRVYDYFIDGSLAEVNHIDQTDPNTPAVSYQYNDPLGRLTAHTDPLGSTSYSYIPFTGGQNGAGGLDEVNGPWADDTLRYAYDWQGRRQSRTVLDDADNPLHSVAYTFDSLGRVTGETNNLGTFTYQYNAGNYTAKVNGVQFPTVSGIDVAYDYYPITGTANDDRLKEIHTSGPGGTISKFNYEYDPNGRIRQWTQQQGGTSALRHYAFAYDRSGQLTDTVVTDAADNVDKSWSWQYDAAGNRLRESLGDASTYSDYNDLNQLTQRGGSGTTLVEGIVDSPSIVMVNDEQAAMYALPAGDYRFQKTLPVAEGSNTITVEATDASQNVRTNVYTVEIGGVQKTLEYDLNGNLRYERDDQGAVLREFQWDARNRLIAIIDGINRTEFEYDGLDRRIRIVEKESGIEQSDVTFLWDGSEIIQKRNAAADTVLRNYFSDGFTEGTNSYFYAKDHLGSIREVIASDGQTIESRYEYTPWGGVTRTAGTGAESDFLYTGHYYHAPSELFLAHYRQYSPEMGRWLSRDPLSTATPSSLAGPTILHQIYNGYAELLPGMLGNLYNYGPNTPINGFDRDGKIFLAPLIGAGVGAAMEGIGQYRRCGKITNWGSVAVSGATGAIGGGFGSAIARNVGRRAGQSIASGIAQRAASNAGVGAGLGMGDAAAKNALDDSDCNKRSIWQGAAQGAFGAGLGSLTGDGLSAGLRSMGGTPLTRGLHNDARLSSPSWSYEVEGSLVGAGTGSFIGGW